MVMMGRNGPVTRAVYVSAALPDKFAFYPHMAGRRLGRMYINRDLRVNTDKEVNLSFCNVGRQDHPDGQHR